MNLGTLLEESGAVLRGHFKLSSGRHSDTYFEKFRVLEQPHVLTALCAEIAAHFRESEIEIIAGPTTGGIIIAFEVARQMGIRAIYVENEDGKKTLRRGAHIPTGAKVMVVDDVLTTGLSVKETVDAVTIAGGSVVGIGVLIDRSDQPLALGAPLYAAYRVEAQSFAEDDLPTWLADVPIRKPGTRA
jgi:orotate phosphoribosyltransferase